jgi:hypothetical protein
MRLWLGFAAVAACLLLIAPTSVAASQASSEAEAAKGKKAKCRGAKVPVTVGKRKTCKPLAKAFPKPKSTDTRLAFLKQALKLDVSKLRAKKAKRARRAGRARSLQSGFGAAGRKAQKKFLALLPKALALIDRRKSARAAASALAPGPAIASAGCGIPPAGPSSNVGGVGFTLLGDSGARIEFSSRGLTFRLTFFSCGGVRNFRVPECPTAKGAVDATGGPEHFEVTTEVRDGNEVLSRQSTSFDHSAKVHGEVGADAKLKFIKVEHTEDVLIVASGGIVLRGKAVRKVKVDMPSGKYDPAGATVSISGDANEALKGTGFAATVDAAISGYRSAEARWSDFDRRPHCAEPVFSPQSNTLKLQRGQGGQVNIHAKARQDGGRATGAKWTLLAPVNADFSPLSSSAAEPSISYTVKAAPSGPEVKVTARFTSTAGVGEGSWTQQTDGPPSKFGGSVSGTATYDAFELGEGNSLQASWSGSVDLSLAPPILPPGFPGAPFGEYKLASGFITYSFSGSIEDCVVEGSEGIDLDAQPDLKEAVLLLLYEGEPRKYHYLVGMPLTAQAQVEGEAKECEDPEDNGDFPWFPGAGAPFLVYAPLPGGPVSADWSLSGSGSGNPGGGGSPEQTWQWDLHPSP